MSQTTVRPALKLPVYFALALLAVFTAAMVLEIVSSEADGERAEADTLPPATITVLLEDADAANGGVLIEQIGCIACHRLGAEYGIAPSFVGIGERAGQRHAPLSAADYLYEAITNPTVFVVDGYNPAMPQNYRSRLSDCELGDIIAYLLSADAH